MNTAASAPLGQQRHYHDKAITLELPSASAISAGPDYDSSFCYAIQSVTFSSSLPSETPNRSVDNRVTSSRLTARRHSSCIVRQMDRIQLLQLSIAGHQGISYCSHRNRSNDRVGFIVQDLDPIRIARFCPSLSPHKSSLQEASHLCYTHSNISTTFALESP